MEANPDASIVGSDTSVTSASATDSPSTLVENHAALLTIILFYLIKRDNIFINL